MDIPDEKKYKTDWITYDFNYVKKYDEEPFNAFIVLYIPCTDSVIFQVMRHDNVINFPGGIADQIKDHKINTDYQNVPYGKILTDNKHNTYENVICTAVREFYEETEIYVYFTDDIDEIDDKYKNNSVDIPYDIDFITGKNGNTKYDNKKFIPIKFVCIYETRGNFIIYATMQLVDTSIISYKELHGNSESKAVCTIPREDILNAKFVDNNFKIETTHNNKKIVYNMRNYGTESLDLLKDIFRKDD